MRHCREAIGQSKGRAPFKEVVTAFEVPSSGICNIENRPKPKKKIFILYAVRNGEASLQFMVCSAGNGCLPYTGGYPIILVGHYLPVDSNFCMPCIILSFLDDGLLTNHKMSSRWKWLRRSASCHHKDACEPSFSFF